MTLANTIKSINIRTMEAYRLINNDKSLTNDQRLTALDKCSQACETAIAHVKRLSANPGIDINA